MHPRALILAAIVLSGCGSNEEPPRVRIPLALSSTGVQACTTSLGYRVTTTRFRMAIQDIELTVGGEAHARRSRGWLGYLVPSAHAHPGHLAGGQVTGELRGKWAASWLPVSAGSLGSATLLAGSYEGANFTFTLGSVAMGLDATKPLVGHTVHLAGTAERGGQTADFDAFIDIEDGVQMTGAVFRAQIGQTTSGTLELQVLTTDLSKSASLYDGIDFFKLVGGDKKASIRKGSTEHSYLKRQIQIHDYYSVSLRLAAP